MTSLAVVIGDRMYDLRDAAKAARVTGFNAAWAKGGIEAMLHDWRAASPWLRRVANAVPDAIAGKKIKAIGTAPKNCLVPYKAQRIFCAAANYVDHIKEMDTALAAKAVSQPYHFLKLQNAVIGYGESVKLPPETKKLDWEVELAAVIGKRARRVSVAKALDIVAGYTVVNDVSARDLNGRTDYPFKHDWFRGKAHDTFAPFGPCIVPAWLIKDPQNVMLKLTVNGETMQNDSSKGMIWTLAEQIAYLSTIVTLEPGDVIATGTPAGVGMGRGIFLKPGDVMEASAEGIGTMRNPVIAEKI
ncbi:MAG: fumarylacetoacetate hydrolase family protein [Burkholderiales bacterium]